MLLFNSVYYYLFLAIVFLLYWLPQHLNKFGQTGSIAHYLQSQHFQNALLLAASYWFFYQINNSFFGLILASTLLDYCLGWAIWRYTQQAKALLIVSILLNLGILFVFKYFNFFLALVGSNAMLHLLLPIGISFYTFHGMSYVFDIYRKKIQPVHSLIDYALFVSFFPLLVAGPIERAQHLLPQLHCKRIFSESQAKAGIKWIIWGLFQKVVIADQLASFVNPVFANYAHYPALVLLSATVAFSIQIYADFSGYTAIAVGSAKLLGISLLNNFKQPYFSKGPVQFWRRWHISLSTWFRDYVFVPLGGSQRGQWMLYRNVAIVFLLSALWHGANTTFLWWGALHASWYLCFKGTKFMKWWFVPIQFIFVTVAWVFFRSPDSHSAIAYLQHLTTPTYFKWQPMPESIHHLIWIPVLLLFDAWCYRFDKTADHLPSWLCVAMCLMVWYFFGSSNAFIYFQF